MRQKIKLYYPNNRTECDAYEHNEALKKYFDFVDCNQGEVFFSSSCQEIADTLSYRRKPLTVHYCWDLYGWALENPELHYFDNKRYLQMMKECDLILVPSKSQQKRLKEYGVESEVIMSGVKTNDIFKPLDFTFVLEPLRYYPVKQERWAEEAGNELGIPVVHTEHKVSEEDFKALKANCKFTICTSPEASTGSLTLVESLWHGKPALVSDSPYQGGKEYMGKFCRTFKHDDFEDLKKQMQEMWDNPIKVDILEAREYILNNFTYDIMAKKIYETIHRHLKTNRKKMSQLGEEKST